MGRIVGSYIFPHPPVIIPEIGEGRERDAEQTVNAVKKAAGNIKRDRPSTIIVTTPHGPVFQDYVYISTSEKIEGNLGMFGKDDVKMEFENNIELVNRIVAHAKDEGIFCGGLEDSIARKYKVSKSLDHGALVPLYFVQSEIKDFKLVHISIAGLPFIELYKFGMCVSKAIQDTNEDVVFLASGDLSHKLSEDAPYGYNKKGRKFDDLFVKSVKELDVEKLLQLDEDFCESAGECGLRSFLIMFGALDGLGLKSDIYSYEAPFGVGYLVAGIAVGERNAERLVLEKIEAKAAQEITQIRKKEDPYVNLARKSVETYVRDGRRTNIPEGLPDEIINNKAGVFVSIKKYGQLRGCIGTTAPTTNNIAEEIIQNAISSSTRDPRFDPVEEDELDNLIYSVDILKEPEPINSIDELDVIKYGVIVRAGSRSGLLLPNLEGVDTPKKQVSIALQKAGIRQNEKYSMERFEVVRHR